MHIINTPEQLLNRYECQAEEFDNLSGPFLHRAKLKRHKHSRWTASVLWIL